MTNRHTIIIYTILLFATPFFLNGQTTYKVSSEIELDDALTAGVDGNIIEIEADITFTTDKDIYNSVTINGNGHTINFAAKSIDISTSCEINDLTITDGYSGFGGAIGTSEQLIINNCTFTRNSGRDAGVIFNTYMLTINNSTFYDNNSIGDAGVISSTGSLIVNNSTFYNNNSGGYAGVIYSPGSLTINNSTFSGNTGGDAGVISSNGSLTVNNSTFSDNSSAEAAIYAIGPSRVKNSTFSDNSGAIYTIGPLNLTNSILANSTGPYDLFTAILSTNINNIVETYEPYFGTILSFFSTADPLLNVLADNGGLTQTMALMAGSPAINMGDAASCLTNDQRGYGRNGTCDIGAFEFDGLPTGACCMPDGSCTTEFEGNCIIAGGVYQGDGTDCTSIGCVPIPTIGQWGLISLMLLVFLLGIVAIRQRIVRLT